MATHSSILAWRIPGTEEPGELPSMGLHRVRHDWLDLAIIFHYMDKPHLFIHLLMDIWVPSSFLLLWMRMQWTFMYKYFLKILLSVLLGMYPELELLYHRVILFLIFGGLTILFSVAAVPFYTPLYSAPGFQFLHILASACYFSLLFLFS